MREDREKRTNPFPIENGKFTTAQEKGLLTTDWMQGGEPEERTDRSRRLYAKERFSLAMMFMVVLSLTVVAKLVQQSGHVHMTANQSLGLNLFLFGLNVATPLVIIELNRSIKELRDHDR